MADMDDTSKSWLCKWAEGWVARFNTPGNQRTAEPQSRLTVRMTDSDRKELLAIQKRTGHDNVADLIGWALVVYDNVNTHTKDGKRVTLGKQDGKLYVVYGEPEPAVAAVSEEGA